MHNDIIIAILLAALGLSIIAIAAFGDVISVEITRVVN